MDNILFKQNNCLNVNLNFGVFWNVAKKRSQSTDNIHRSLKMICKLTQKRLHTPFL